MASNQNYFKVWGFPDNRTGRDRETGTRKPCVCVYRFNPSNSHGSESVGMTPRQARLMAAALLQAADYAEIQTTIKKFERRFV